MQHTDVVAERDYTPLHSLDEAVELSAVDVALQHALGGGSKSVVQCAHLAHELCGVLLGYRRPQFTLCLRFLRLLARGPRVRGMNGRVGWGRWVRRLPYPARRPAGINGVRPGLVGLDRDVEQQPLAVELTRRAEFVCKLRVVCAGLRKRGCERVGPVGRRDERDQRRLRSRARWVMLGEQNRTSVRYRHGLDADVAAVDDGPHGAFGAAALHDAHGGGEVGAADRARGAGFPRAGIGGRWGSVGSRRRVHGLQEQRGLLTAVTQVRGRGACLSRGPQIPLHFSLDAVGRREGSLVGAFLSDGRLRVIG